jgi:peptide-methionine (S)-S-oxide reductase
MLVSGAFAAEAPGQDGAAMKESTMGRKTEVATLGGGCFWCLEAVYERIEGVNSVTSGYAGGTAVDPSYEEVCSGRTGHAEVVQIEYDPVRISYEKILDLFWKAHDPTTLNRQGADAGTQYRSIILYHDQTQKKAAEESKRKARSMFEDPIVTEIKPLERFYPAEKYHQDYFDRNPNAGYCRIVIQPKLEKLNLL